ncbi:DUF11 domain-containing protein [Chloroflexia bacterium SDU3-3]|nr:DUF11 domain-containing protein [Chloroflexia bacterium SDU3-3]
MVVLLLLAALLPQASAHAEGSGSLASSGGYRPYLEWAPGTYNGNIERKTILSVYVNAGETINLGSSVTTSSDGQDIVYRSPAGTQNGTCDVLAGGYAFIDTVAKESAGPLPNAGGYTPCTITAAETGIYEVEFHSPGSGNPTPAIAVTGAFPANANQASTVAAWDITVRDSGGAAKPGRVFTSYLAMNMGANFGNPTQGVSSEMYIQTSDGYRYRIDLNNLDPFGFIFFSNNKGFRDLATGNALYRSVQFTGANPGQLPSTVDLHLPGTPDTATDITQKIFFETPSSDLPAQASSPSGTTWLLVAPVAPPTPSNFIFTGSEGTPGAAGTSPLNGNFSFDTPNNGSYSIIIDANGDGIYGNANDRILLGTATAGSNTVPWDGRDANGMQLPAGNMTYGAEIELFAGEVHFPFFDAEHNPNGIIIERVVDPGTTASPPDPYQVYYDDTYYYDGTNTYDYSLCAQGQTPSAPAAANIFSGGCYGIAPTPRSARAGVLSTTGAQAYSDNFGNIRGIDTWVYYPSQKVGLAQPLALRESDLQITKTHSPATVVPGQQMQYTVTVHNAGPSDVTGARVQDTVPAALSGVTWSCAVTTGTGACTSPTGSGNAIDTLVNLATGATATFTIVGTLSPSVAGTISNTATVTRPNDVTDPNLTNNTATDIATVAENPQIGVAKRVLSNIDNNDGTFDVTYEVLVRNLGNVALQQVQLSDNLATTFAGAQAFQVVSAPSSPTLATQGAYTGSAPNINLLQGTDTLAVGASGTVQLTVRVTPGTLAGPYNNQVTASGTTSGGTPTTDLSQNGNTPDPNGNGDPGDPGEDTPTPVTFTLPPPPQIGVAKRVLSNVDNHDGTFDVTYEVLVRNLGNVALQQVQLSDNLATTFAGAQAFQVVSAPSSPTLATQSAYTGRAPNINLLQGTDTLAIGASGTVQLTVRVTPGTLAGPYNNQVTASGTTSGGIPTTDLSQNGTNPDPNGNSNPGDPGEDTPTPVTFKTPTAITLSALTATRQAAGGVLVGWATSAEQDTAGFSIYRGATSSFAAAAKVSGALIPATGGQRPASYTWLDTAPTEGAYYWLVEVDTRGKAHAYGPVRATPAPAAGTSVIYLPLLAR